MRVLLALLVAAQNPVVPAPPPPPSPTPDTAHLVIVATTDVHGRVLGWDYVHDVAAPGGLARAATILETLRAQYPDQVVLVDAGDLIEGNLFAAYFARRDQERPHPLVDALNAMQYDAATPGNHDFDFGPSVLARALQDATYRYVSANVYRGGTDTLLYAPYSVIERAGVKVGITGFTTPGVMVWDRGPLGGRVRVRRIEETAPAALQRLEQAGAEVRVVLIHSGLGEPASYDTTGVGAENAALSLAGIVPRPDVVIVGHTHREVRDYVVNGVHFVQPKNGALSLAVVHAWLTREPGTGDRGPGAYRVTSVRADLLPLTSTPELPRFTRRFAAAHERVRTWAATPLGSAGPGFSGRFARAEDTPLLDFINEVQRRRAGADLSAAADFDLDAGLPEGEVRMRDVAGIYPYENTLRAVRISGRQLREYLEHAARYFRTYQPGAPIVDDSVPGSNYDVVSGANYDVDLSQPPGQRIRGLAFRGRPVQPTDSFTLALASYRQEGGGGYTMLQGAPALKPWLDSLARACGCTTVRLDGGDEMQGTLLSNFSFGLPAIATLNAFGIDAATIGNHEFDWSVDTLRARMAGAKYRFLAANITDSGGTARPEWAEPWTLIQRGGLKIAVIGLALRATPTNTAPRNVRGLAFGDGAAAVRRVLPRARAAADFVIVVAHEGAFCDGAPGPDPVPAGACHGEIVDIARGLDSGTVDLIVSGHTHSLVNTVVHGIPIVQARSSGAGIAVVDFVRVRGTERQVRARIETHYADQVRPDAALADTLRPYQRDIETVTGRSVARIKTELRRGGEEYALGRLIADAQRNMTKTDVALVNSGGIRADLAAGTVTYGDLYQMQPFQNRLVRLFVQGKILTAALEHAVAGDRADAHASGLEVWYDPRKRVGHRVTKVRLANGRGLDDGRTYTVAVSDFLAAGGSGYTMFRGLPAEDLGLVDLDALIQYLAVLRPPVEAPGDARVHRR